MEFWSEALVAKNQQTMKTILALLIVIIPIIYSLHKCNEITHEEMEEGCCYSCDKTKCSDIEASGITFVDNYEGCKSSKIPKCPVVNKKIEKMATICGIGLMASHLLHASPHSQNHPNSILSLHLSNSFESAMLDPCQNPDAGICLRMWYGCPMSMSSLCTFYE